MKAKLLLRISAGILLFHNVGHNMGQLSWKHSPDPAKQQVIDGMLSIKSPFMGATHSMADYYDGYSYICTLVLLLIPLLLWFVSDDSSIDSPLARKTVIAITIVLLLWGVVELIYFFPFAASFTFAAMLLNIGALLKMNKATIAKT